MLHLCISSNLASLRGYMMPNLNLISEYQLTDSTKVLVEKGAKFVYKRILGIHIDVGTSEDLKGERMSF